MAHRIEVTSAYPENLWRVIVDGREVLAFGGPSARELAERSSRDLEYFLRTQRADLHDVVDTRSNDA